VLGLDYGDKCIGVAVSDPLGYSAQGLETICRRDEASVKKSVARIGEIIKFYGVKTIVLGYPKNMDGSEGERCLKTAAFKERLLRNFKRVEVVLWDERLTTAAARRAMEGANRAERGALADHIDQIAAALILNGYLEYIAKNNKT